jgi:hypothetical protein
MLGQKAGSVALIAATSASVARGFSEMRVIVGFIAEYSRACAAVIHLVWSVAIEDPPPV